MKRKVLLIITSILLVLVAVYLLGPKMPKPELSMELPEAISNPLLAEQIIKATEAGYDNIRPGNQSLIVWENDSLKSKTKYSVLYLHGFSASPMEGNPVHVNFAQHFGLNTYIPRLAEHGLRSEAPLLNMTPEALWESAKIAFVHAQALGEKVIIMGTSTGGTLALMLAAHFPEDVAGLFLYAPNVRLYDKTAGLLDRPWGLQIARQFMGGDMRILEEDPETDAFWYNKYRVESLVYLQQLIRTTMKADTFEKITCPVFTGYYFKDEDNQDNTVSVSAINWMFDLLGTSPDQKLEVAFPDAGTHVICCELTTDHWQEVLDESIHFAETVLKLN